jgi:hypothetical protein
VEDSGGSTFVDGLGRLDFEGYGLAGQMICLPPCRREMVVREGTAVFKLLASKDKMVGRDAGVDPSIRPLTATTTTTTMLDKVEGRQF